MDSESIHEEAVLPQAFPEYFQHELPEIHDGTCIYLQAGYKYEILFRVLVLKEQVEIF